jgi:hypothetical protein
MNSKEFELSDDIFDGVAQFYLALLQLDLGILFS